MRWICSGIALVVCSAQAPAQKNLCAKANQPVDAKVLLTTIGRSGAKISDLHRLCRVDTRVQIGFGKGQTVLGFITYLTPEFFEVQFVPSANEPRHRSATIIHIPLGSLRSVVPQLRGTMHLEIRTDY